MLTLFRHIAPVVGYLNEPLLAAARDRDPLAVQVPRGPKRLSRELVRAEQA